MKRTVVVITGASAGLGRAIAREFAAHKSLIGLIARDTERLEETKKEIEALGGKALLFPIDVAHSDQIDKAAQTIEEQLGPIDIWINNAMVSVFSPAFEMNASEYKRVTEVTYLGYVYGTLAALRYMKPRDKGMIMQMGSALAYRAIPLQSAYCGAKHAIQGFTESIRSELMHDKSHVKISMVQLPAMNTTHFGWVKNRLKRKPHPIPPIYQPELIAKVVFLAAHHYRREWYIGAMTAVIIMGNHFFSGIGDWYLAKHYKDQTYDGLAEPNQPNNLYEPIPGNYQVRGEFNQEAVSRSLYIWLNQRRKWFFSILMILLFLFIILIAIL